MQAVCNLFLYADDSALLISDKVVGRIQVNLGKELPIISCIIEYVTNKKTLSFVRKETSSRKTN